MFHMREILIQYRNCHRSGQCIIYHIVNWLSLKITRDQSSPIKTVALYKIRNNPKYADKYVRVAQGLHGDAINRPRRSQYLIQDRFNLSHCFSITIVVRETDGQCLAGWLSGWLNWLRSISVLADFSCLIV